MKSFAAPPSLLQLFLLLVPAIHSVQATFNYEVERRVFERIDDFMSGPMIVTSLLERFLANGAFPHQGDVRDRDAYATLSYSLLNEYKFDMIYYGTEDGVFVGYVSYQLIFMVDLVSFGCLVINRGMGISRCIYSCSSY